MALYRFLFAPVLLALAVVAGRSPEPPDRRAPAVASQLSAPAAPRGPALSVALERAAAPRPVRAR